MGADRVGGQLQGNEECPFSGVTKYGRVWRNEVPESGDAARRVSAPSLTTEGEGPGTLNHGDLAWTRSSRTKYAGGSSVLTLGSWGGGGGCASRPEAGGCYGGLSPGRRLGRSRRWLTPSLPAVTPSDSRRWLTPSLPAVTPSDCRRWLHHCFSCGWAGGLERPPRRPWPPTLPGRSRQSLLPPPPPPLFSFFVVCLLVCFAQPGDSVWKTNKNKIWPNTETTISVTWN